MCTVTWDHSGDEYEVFCNRDEQRSRLRAIAPRTAQQKGVSCIAPIDGNFGGTWIGVNDRGLTLCLLNASPADGASGRISRGLLVLELLASASPESVLYTLKHTNLEDYSAFTLVVVASRMPVMSTHWDQSSKPLPITHESAHGVISSSSFEPDGVIKRRVDLYTRTARRGAAYHASHENGPGASSVCMHREDAETVSFTRVSVTTHNVSLAYSPQAPCRGIRPATLSLPLHR